MSLLWWRYDKVSLVTPLAAAECVARLRASTQSEWKLFGDAEAVASIKELSFRIRKRRWVKMQTVLYGRLSNDDHGNTRIECRIGAERIVVALGVAWTLIVMLGFGTTLVNLRGANIHEAIGNIVIMALGWLTFPVGVLVSRILWDDGLFLQDFLCRTLQAREVPADPHE